MDVIKQLFCFSHMANLLRSFFSLSSFSLCLSFFSQFCCPPYRLSFTLNFDWFSVQEKGKISLKRVVGK